MVTCTVHAAEDSMVKEDYIAGAMSVGKRSMESQAAEMLETEEKSEAMVNKQSQGESDLGEGESVKDDDGSIAPWVVEEKATKKKQAVRRQESKIEAAMHAYDAQKSAGNVAKQAPVASNDGPDLGESAGVGAMASNANAMTASAHARAHAQARLREKTTALSRAKQIADKVRNLVKQQQKAEKTAGTKLKGSVLGKAVQEHDKAVQATSQDELLAHKMEDEQTQTTMMHLIESERKEQRNEFEQERSATHATLAKIRKKLAEQQARMVKQMQVSAAGETKKLQASLGNTKIAQTIENVVKKKLAVRLGQLQKTAQKTVQDVTSQVAALKSRVRRLRREQTRMKIAEAQQQQTRSRDLGESASTGTTAALQAEVAQMRMMMMQQQQQQFAAPAAAEHEELMKMRQQMAEMQKQNAMFKKMLATKAQTRLAQASRTHYSTADLQNYFIHKNHAVSDLKNEVAAEKKRLSALTSKLSAAQASPLPGAQFLMQVAEGGENDAMPLYHQRAEQARIEMEELQKQQQEATLELDRVQDAQKHEVEVATHGVVDELDE